MRLNKIQMLPVALAIIMLAATLLVVGCNTAPNRSDSLQDATYRLSGFFVKDVNRYSCHSEVALWREDSTLETADILFDDDTLAYLDDVYQMTVLPESVYPAGSYYLQLGDSSLYRDSVEAYVADTFSIEIIDPATRDNPGGTQVSLTWTNSLSADGYIVATVPRYIAYHARGYSAWVSSQSTGETIPPDAFPWSDGINPDTGWYFVYVYAYTGVPDSSLSAGMLPVPMPGQPLDNIDRERLTGCFGAVTVALRDSVRVTVLQ